MKVNYRNSIASIRKFPQFTTMNVKFVPVRFFCSLTIDNILNIIVLLILAGVAITMLTGDNGILNTAAQAKEETRGGQVQEARDLWRIVKTSDNYSTEKATETLDQLLERIDPNDQKLLTADEVEEVKETGQVTIGSRTIVFIIEDPKTGYTMICKIMMKDIRMPNVQKRII